MSCQSAGASFGPVFLRICLGLVFIWAGLGKVLSTSSVTGSDATVLREMGVTPRTATIEGATGTPKADAGDELEVSNAYMVALSLRKAAAPVEVDGRSMRLWPDALAKGRWPVWAAYACVLTELLGGTLILFGGLTRLSAFGIACVMATAMWLTQIGPALQSGKTKLGFLPAYDTFGPDWQHLLFQFALFCTAMALVFTGSGCLGIDRLLFGKRSAAPSRPKPEPAQ